MKSFRNLNNTLNEGLKVTTFDSTSKECFHFVQKEHAQSITYTCFDTHALHVAQLCYDGNQEVLRNEAGVNVLTVSGALFPRVVSSLLEAHICVKVWKKIPDSTSRHRWVLDSAATPGDTTGIRQGDNVVSIAALNILWSGRALSVGVCFSIFPIAVFELEAASVAVQMAE